MTDSLKLSPKEAYEFIAATVRMRQVPYIAGPPAIGKSQIVHQLAKDSGAKMIDLRLSQMLSEDMTGIPERNEKSGKAYYMPFETFPLEGDEIPKGYNGWFLFLDELSSATEEVLAAAYSIILDRMVGGKKLHPKCVVIAAGNRSTDSAIARVLPDTLITRMLPIELEPSVKDWLEWAERPEVNSHDFVTAFIKKNPSMLVSTANAKDRDEMETFETPRGWEKVFAHMHYHEKHNKEEVVDAAGIPIASDNTETRQGTPLTSLTFHLIASAVGFMAARSFRDEYDEQIQLPYPWEIAQAPSSARIPVSALDKSQITLDLAQYFVESKQQARDAVLVYINRMDGEQSELFLHHISKELGTSATNKRIIDMVQERLSIDPLLGTKSVKGASGTSNPDSTF